MEKTHYENLSGARIAYESAMARGNGVAAAKETLKNLLFNYSKEIVNELGSQQALHDRIAELEGETAALNEALAEADNELAEAKAKAGKKPASEKRSN